LNPFVVQASAELPINRVVEKPGYPLNVQIGGMKIGRLVPSHSIVGRGKRDDKKNSSAQ
jgi:hypothetical protein